MLADAAACFADVARPVQAQCVCADFCHAFQPQPAAFGKHDDRHAPAFAFAFQSGNNLADVFEAEFFKRRIAQDAAPSVENLHSLRSRVDLGVEVGGNGLGVGIEDFVQQIGARVHHGFDGAEFFAAAAFDHVTGERERTAGEADKRYAAVQCFTDGSYRVENVLQFFHIGDVQFGNVVLVLQGAFEFRAFAFGKIQSQAHCVGDGQDVGKQNRRVQIETFQRLDGNFGRQFGVFAQIEEAARFRACGFVFGQITPRLTHHPNRRVFDGLFKQGAEEGIVF